MHSVLKIDGSDAGVAVDRKLYELFSWYIKNITQTSFIASSLVHFNLGGRM